MFTHLFFVHALKLAMDLKVEILLFKKMWRMVQGLHSNFKSKQ